MSDNFHDNYDDGMDSSSSLAFGNTGHPTAALGPSAPLQLKEYGLRLNAGLKNIEAGPIEASVFETIPQEHYEEIRRLAKLTESNPSFHAPTVGMDPAGFKQGRYEEGNREQVEEQLKSVVERAYKMYTGKGDPIRINMHTSDGVPAYIFNKDKDLKFGKDGKKNKADYVKTLMVVNQENGQAGPLPVERRYHGEEIKNIPRYENPYERLEEINKKEWERVKLQLRSRDLDRQMAEDTLKDEGLILRGAVDEPMNSGEKPLEKIKIRERTGTSDFGGGGDESRTRVIDTSTLARKYMRLKASERLNEENLMLASKDSFEKYLKYYKPKENNKKDYERVKKEYAKLVNRYNKQKSIQEKFETKLSKKLIGIDDPIKRYRETKQIESQIDEELKKAGISKSISSEHFANLLDTTGTPQIYQPVEDFSLGKSAETISNIGLKSYNLSEGNYKKAPVVTVENWQPEMPFSRGESLKTLIKSSRKKLAKKLRKEKGLSRGEAKKAAEAIVGATWDVGHIYQLKKYGFDEKDVIKETEKIAGKGKEKGKFLKHMHITDNFGYHDSHLAPGMGTVPIKEMLKKVQDSGYEGNYIIEAGAVATSLGQNPIPASAESLNNPFYSYENSPTWQSVRDIYQSYTSGIGDILPEHHFRQLYGGGFSSLPSELGGQSAGDRSRLTGDSFN